MCNDWIDISTPPAEDRAALPPPSHVIRSVSIFDSPSVLLKFDSVDSKAKFEKICVEKPEFLSEFNLKARIHPCTYAIIMCFVLCSGQFNPGNDAHLREVAAKNDIPPNTIALATWCKRPENRSPNQKSVTIKVLCTSPESANLFIIGRIQIDNHLANVHKNIKLPIQCFKCQDYSHTRDSCIRVERCTNCASVSHATLLSPKNVLHSTNAPQKTSCHIFQPMRPGLGLLPQLTLHGLPPHCPKPPHAHQFPFVPTASRQG